MVLLASLLPAVPETLSLRLCPFVPSFLPSPTPLILSILFGSQFWLDLQTRTLPSPGVFLPSGQRTPGPHSLPLPALLFNSFCLLLRTIVYTISIALEMGTVLVGKGAHTVGFH